MSLLYLAETIERLAESEENAYSQIEELGNNNYVEEEVEENPIFQEYDEKDLFVRLTNFNKLSVEDLDHSMKPQWEMLSGRGKKSSISRLDCLTILLTFYKSGVEIDNLAISVNRKATAVRNAINRTRPVLLLTLEERWLKSLPRPVPLAVPGFSDVALLLDSTSFEVYRKLADFQESKILYDGKNRIYALKKEVAVSASPPYFALFIRKSAVGSMHDFQMFKSGMDRYKNYLRILPSDVDPLTNRTDWSICADKGYIGEVDGITMVTPKKKQRNARLTHQELIYNRDVAKVRIPVEQFFGRLKSCWRILANTYRMDHANFDTDADNCILLTNELIKISNLSDVDLRAYKRNVELRKAEAIQKYERKRKAQQKYKENKKKKYDSLRESDIIVDF